MKLEEHLLRENIRASSYKLLSECYYSPDERLIKMLGSLEKSRGTGLILELSKNVPAMDGLELLKIEYSRLFLGPFKVLVPPYGSVYLEDGRKVMGESTMDVKNWYREERLDMLLKEVPDHIAVELEFMYFLVFKQIEAIKDSDEEMAGNYLRKQASFLKTHLGKWAPEFTEKVEANAQTEFYKNLARLTRSFIEEDLNNLSVNLFPAL